MVSRLELVSLFWFYALVKGCAVPSPLPNSEVSSLARHDQFPMQESVPTARYKGTFRWWFRNPSPVDMENLPTIIYNILYMSGGCLGFLNHQQDESHRPRLTRPYPHEPGPSSQCLQSKALRKMTLFWCRVACVTTHVKPLYFTRKKLNKNNLAETSDMMIQWYWCNMFKKTLVQFNSFVKIQY